ncbi:MAG: hypothetical protein K2I71_02965 [Helicobacter sp.]|nr:hypothetical protein [Helicobacter sp.]
MEKEKIEADFELNPSGEVTPKWDSNVDISSKIKAAYKIRVNGVVTKIGSTQQSPSKCVWAFKNGQKNGDPSKTTLHVFKEINNALLGKKKVTIEFIQVKGKKTPKDLCDELIKEYKKQNDGRAPEWNKQSNKEKWEYCKKEG